jgi:hypothetical protein
MELMRFCFRTLGKRNDEENAKEKLYTYASYVPVTSFKASLLLVHPHKRPDQIRNRVCKPWLLTPSRYSFDLVQHIPRIFFHANMLAYAMLSKFEKKESESHRRRLAKVPPTTCKCVLLLILMFPTATNCEPHFTRH